MPELSDDQTRVLRTLYEWQYVPMPVGQRLPTKVPDYLVSAVLADLEWDIVKACLDGLVGDGLATTEEAMFGGRWVLSDHREIIACVWDNRIPGVELSVRDKLRVLYGDGPNDHLVAAGFSVKIREPEKDFRTHIEWHGLTNRIPDNAYSLTKEGRAAAKRIIGLVPNKGLHDGKRTN